MANQVRLYVSHRFFEAVSDAGLRTEMDDAVDVDRVGEGPEGVGFREVHAFEAETIAELLLQQRESRLFE
jgi:hypothetical protein